MDGQKRARLAAAATRTIEWTMNPTPPPGPASARPEAPPYQIVVNPTRRCNYHCRHCDRPLDPAAPELPIALILRTMTEIRERYGPRWYTLAGGEPLLWGGTLDFIAHAKELGNGVNVATNGALLTPRRARDLGRWGLDEYSLSLDGFEEMHDALRGPGAFARATAGLDLLAREAPAVRVGITCVIQRHNAARLAEFARFCRDLHGFKHLNFQAFVSHEAHLKDRAWYLDHPLWPEDPAAVGASLEELAVLSEREPGWLNAAGQLRMMRAYFDDPTRFVFTGCQAWKRVLVIEANGDVKNCAALGPFGNLHRGPFADAWDSPEHAASHERALQCRRVCHMVVNCGFIPETVAAP